jgi:hypothetical protein
VEVREVVSTAVGFPDFFLQAIASTADRNELSQLAAVKGTARSSG